MKFFVNGEAQEGSKEYALRLMEQGKKVEFPEETKEPEQAETKPEAEAPKAEAKAKKGK